VSGGQRLESAVRERGDAFQTAALAFFQVRADRDLAHVRLELEGLMERHEMVACERTVQEAEAAWNTVLVSLRANRRNWASYANPVTDLTRFAIEMTADADRDAEVLANAVLRDCVAKSFTKLLQTFHLDLDYCLSTWRSEHVPREWLVLLPAISGQALQNLPENMGRRPTVAVRAAASQASAKVLSTRGLFAVFSNMAKELVQDKVADAAVEALATPRTQQLVQQSVEEAVRRVFRHLRDTLLTELRAHASHLEQTAALREQHAADVAVDFERAATARNGVRAELRAAIDALPVHVAHAPHAPLNHGFRDFG